MFKSDHSFRIGAQHLRSGMPCQDYALSGVTTNGRAYAIVSDGCSSGGNTEIGAALTSVVTKNFLTNTVFCPTTWDIYDGISKVRDHLLLPTNDFLATCCYVSIDASLIEFRLIGDGALAWQEGDKLNMSLVSWNNNMPLYPIYGDDGFNSFIKAHGGMEKAATVITNNEPPSSEHLLIYGGYGKILYRDNHPDITKVAIFTDGVCQVPGMNWQEVITELMAFKSTEGDFVKRRLNRFLKDHSIMDDLGYTCIQIEQSGV